MIWGKRIEEVTIVRAPESLLDDKMDLELEEVIVAMPSAPAKRIAEIFYFSSRRRHTIFDCDWSSDVCSSDLLTPSPWESDLCRGSGSGRCASARWTRTPKGISQAERAKSWRNTRWLRRQARRARRSEERRVGKECRSRWSPYH